MDEGHWYTKHRINRNKYIPIPSIPIANFISISRMKCATTASIKGLRRQGR